MEYLLVRFIGKLGQFFARDDTSSKPRNKEKYFFWDFVFFCLLEGD